MGRRLRMLSFLRATDEVLELVREAVHGYISTEVFHLISIASALGRSHRGAPGQGGPERQRDGLCQPRRGCGE